MTGFGRAEVIENNKRYTVELKSVNHRYLDLSVKTPRALSSLDGNVRAEIKKYLSRGKVDVYISFENLSESEAEIKYNHDLASKYAAFVKEISEEFGLENDLRATRLQASPMYSKSSRRAKMRMSSGQDLRRPLTVPAKR